MPMATACHQSLMEVSRQFLFIEVGACSSDNSPMIFSENDPSPANVPLRLRCPSFDERRVYAAARVVYEK